MVVVADGRTKDDEIPGVEIGSHLARHGLEVEVRRPVADVANMILSHAADNAVDFMAMSGYPACAKFVLGATVPVLMVH
jgi:hypothetical protein